MNDAQKKALNHVASVARDLTEHDLPAMIGQLAAMIGNDKERSIIEAALPLWRLGKQLVVTKPTNPQAGWINYEDPDTRETHALMQVITHKGEAANINTNVLNALLVALCRAHAFDNEFIDLLKTLGFEIRIPS